MSVLPGDPAALTERATGYQHSALAIREAADALRSLVLDSEARSLDQVRDKAVDVASDLDGAYTRYSGTANALADYAVALQAAHAKADSASNDLAWHQNQLGDAYDDVAWYDRQLDRARDDPSTPYSRIDELEEGLRTAQSRVTQLQGAVDREQSEIDAAGRDLAAAAETAISRIGAAIAGTNDGWLAGIQKLVEDAGQWLANLWQSFADFMAGVVKFIRAIVDTICTLLAFVVIILVALLVLTALLAMFLATPWAFLIAAVIATMLAGFILKSILGDVLKPTPEVREFDPEGHLDAMPGVPDVRSALDETAEVDNLGGTEGDDQETVVKITKIVDADGTVRWRVVLPSTQEWLTQFGGLVADGGDAGGTNDLDSNLALMLTPALQTQYERAVLEAMRQAGIGPGDPVLLVGFSQGGIMAGHLAAYNNEFNWDAIIVSGAPIDAMPILRDVEVVSVQHHGDPVPRLDTVVGLGLEGYQQNNEHWLTIAAYSAKAHDGVEGIHNAEQYSNTLSKNIDTVIEKFPDLQDYFTAGENVRGTETSYYAWNE